MGQQPTWKKYILVLFITVAVFGATFLLSNFFNNRKLSSLQTIQDSIAIDIMSSETQFSLLSELSCKEVDAGVLSQELNSLAEKIEFSEKNISTNKAEVQKLKKYYTLLQIKDYILMNKISERCKKPITSILYVYTTADNCSECTRQGYVLTELRERYPDLRVYAFDYNVEISALRALLSLFKIKDTNLPAIVVDEKVYTGFQSIETIESLLPKSFIESHAETTDNQASVSPTDKDSKVQTINKNITQ